MRPAVSCNAIRFRYCHPAAASNRYTLVSNPADAVFAFDRRIAMTENAVRNLAERPVAYAKDAVEESTLAADQAFKAIEQAHAKAAKSAADLNLHFIGIARANMNAAFDFAQQLVSVKSPSELFELSAAHARKQFEVLSEQIKQLSALVQRVATDSAQPLQSGTAKVFDKVA
jgi:phasin